MEDFRSKSCGDGRMQLENYYGPAKTGFSGGGDGGGGGGGPTSYGINGMQDLRCYSASYASSVHPAQTQPNHVRFKKGKSMNGSSAKSWSLSDPELQRKKRVASYKVYTVEGKVKGSLKKSFRWIKDRCSRVVYGWW